MQHSPTDVAKQHECDNHDDNNKNENKNKRPAEEDDVSPVVVCAGGENKHNDNNNNDDELKDFVIGRHDQKRVRSNDDNRDVNDNNNAAKEAAAAAGKHQQDKNEQVLDLAKTLGYKAGDRFQVRWEIEVTQEVEEEEEDEEEVDEVEKKEEKTSDNNANDDDAVLVVKKDSACASTGTVVCGDGDGADREEPDSAITTAKTTADHDDDAVAKPSDSNVTTITHWWSGTLLEYDGRTTDDNVAIRVLDYDPYPNHGFHERSMEDIVFLGDDILVDYNTQEPLQYRIISEEQQQTTTAAAGVKNETTGENIQEDDQQENKTSCSSSARDMIIQTSRDKIEEVVNATLMNALTKNSERWNSLTRAQQALISDKIAKKKEKLVELLQDHPNHIITPADIHAMLATMVE